jgi:hypothetical protein
MASLPAIQDSIDSTLSQRRELEAAHRQAKKAKLLKGLRAGQKVGKHRVLAGSVDVQLGEDLSENMREVKVRRSFAWLYQPFTDFVLPYSPKVIFSGTDFGRCKAAPLLSPVSDSCMYPLSLYKGQRTNNSNQYQNRAKRNVLRTKEYEKHAWKRFE